MRKFNLFALFSRKNKKKEESSEESIKKEQKIVDSFHNSEYDFFRFIDKIDWATFDPGKKYPIYATDPYFFYRCGDLISLEMKKSYYIFEIVDIEQNESDDTTFANIVGSVKFHHQIMKPEEPVIEKRKPNNYSILR